MGGDKDRRKKQKTLGADAKRCSYMIGRYTVIYYCLVPF